MADKESFSEDITGLWGAPEESVLEPPRPNGTVTNAASGRCLDVNLTEDNSPDIFNTSNGGTSQSWTT
mgnify:CR=1 FL=1